MKYKKFGNKYVVRIEKGEELVETLKNFCRKEEIKLGTISGIGASNKITLGLFKTDTKEYVSNEYQGDYEITSLLGNISRKDGEIYLHLHANIADIDGKVKGGHLSLAVISATFETVIEKVDGEVDRYFDEEIGLNLFEGLINF